MLIISEGTGFFKSKYQIGQLRKLFTFRYSMTIQADVKLVWRGECCTWNWRFIRCPGSIPTRGNIFESFITLIYTI